LHGGALIEAKQMNKDGKKKMHTHKLPQQAGFDMAIIKWWFCQQQHISSASKRKLNGDLVSVDNHKMDKDAK
jgi:hypothetical protein